jgi:hypothetical protein
LRREGVRLAGDPEPTPVDEPKTGAHNEFVPRSKLTDLFYRTDDPDHTKQMKDRGIDLHWIGVGTWVLPAETILSRHQEAWRISTENLGRGHSASMEGVQRISRLKEITRLVQEVPLSNYQNLAQQKPTIENLRIFLTAYQDKLNQAYDLFCRDKDTLTNNESVEVDPEKKRKLQEELKSLQENLDKLGKAVQFLSRYTNRWL